MNNAALWALGGVLLAGMLMRMPIGFSMIASGIAYLVVKRQDLGLVAEQVSNGLYNSYVLLAVPMFVLAANVMNAGTVSERLFDFCRILVGRLRGGLAQVDILVSVIFSGMSGSAIADAAGPGLVTIRQMLKKPEYSRGFAGAVVVASATLGPIIPPSIPMVIYGLVSGASVGALFLGGVMPGVLMALLMMVVVQVIAVRRNMPREAPVPLSQWPSVLFRGALPLSMPIVLLGGIYSGAFTPTEAAAVAAAHALILACIVYRALNWRQLFAVVLESTRSSAVITLILAGSFLLNYAFTAEGVPQAMAAWVDALHLSPVAVPAAGQRDVPGARLFSRRLGAAAGLRADAAAGRQGARHRPRALRRAGGAEHDDRPDPPAVRHAALRHQGADRHPDRRDDEGGLALHRHAAAAAAGDDAVPADRAVAAADDGLRSEMTIDVVCIASFNADLVSRVTRPVARGETVMASAFDIQPGGKGSNAAIACARQGSRTAVVARLGDDDFGRMALALWAREGIDASAVEVAPGERSGVAQIWVYDDGDNSIAVAPGAGAALGARQVHAAAALLRGAKVVMASCEVPFEATQAAFEIAREGGAITLLNPAPARPLPAGLLQVTDLLTPNEGELMALAGESDIEAAARMLLARGPRAVMVTLGARGCALYRHDATPLHGRATPCAWPTPSAPATLSPARWPPAWRVASRWRRLRAGPTPPPRWP